MKITKIILVVGAALIIWFVVSVYFSTKIYGYKQSKYHNEIDSFFKPNVLNKYIVKRVYKSGTDSYLYFVNYDSLSNFVVIETSNFNAKSLNKIQTLSVGKILSPQIKAIEAILVEPFPIFSVLLNPKKSDFITILLEEPNQILQKKSESRSFYLLGDFYNISIGNSQNCYMITFNREVKNEILFFRHNNRIYIMLQNVVAKSLIDIINPDLLN